MAWRIEPLTSPDEIDAVLAVEHASFSNPWTRDMYLAELENEGVSFVFVARVARVAKVASDAGGSIVGFVAFWRIFDELHLNNLAVVPEMRRQGMATALLERVLSEGERLGATRTTLEVRRSNEVALKLYERFGFSVAGVRRAYYTHPEEDALILWREAGGSRRP
jgi:[ribosomal protein S18]-alanine N-acetyltransferase